MKKHVMKILLNVVATSLQESMRCRRESLAYFTAEQDRLVARNNVLEEQDKRQNIALVKQGGKIRILTDEVEELGKMTHLKNLREVEQHNLELTSEIEELKTTIKDLGGTIDLLHASRDEIARERY
jgi:hypothetical protein